MTRAKWNLLAAPQASWLGSLLVVGLLVGCRGSDSVPRPTFGEADAPYVPRASSGNTFDVYANAATDLEATGSKYLTRTMFTDGMKAAATLTAGPAVKRVRAATTRPCEFQFRTRLPFTPAPFLSGWRLIGRVMVWQIEAQAKAGELDAAIDTTLAATRFGFDLTQGDAMTANLGCTLIDESRMALRPATGQMTPEQLYRLAQGLKAAAARGPSLENCARYEAKQSLVAAQYVYDSAAARDLKEISSQLGAAGDNIAKQLTKESGSPASLAAFVGKYADEARRIGAIHINAAGLPAVNRPELNPKLEKGRPWKSLSQNFLSAVPATQSVFDRSLARTRMWVIATMMERIRKKGEIYPADLTKFSENVRTDPFSGGDFGYQTDGLAYKLFSNGANLTDDGGETDEAGLAPDLTLETVRPYPIPIQPKVVGTPATPKSGSSNH